MEAVAKRDFIANGEDELSFKKGDILKVFPEIGVLPPADIRSTDSGQRLIAQNFKLRKKTEILSTDDDWCQVELKGSHGCAPRMYIEMNFPVWYHKGLSRHEAEDILMKKEPGFFIIRDSQSSPGDFSISVRHEEDVQHFKVMRDNRGNYYLWTEKFQSVNALVAHYKNVSISRQKQILLKDGSREEQERRVGSMPISRGGSALADRPPQPMPSRRHTEAEISRYVPGPQQDRRVASLDRIPLAASRMTARPPATNWRNVNHDDSGYVEAQADRRLGEPEKNTQQRPRFPIEDESSVAPSYQRTLDPPATKQTQQRLVRALYDFEALEDDELGFHCDDVIEVLNSSDPSWWFGRFRGREGLFPVSYVEIINR